MDIYNELENDAYYTELQLCKIALNNYIDALDEERYKFKFTTGGMFVIASLAGLIFLITKIIGG